MVMVDQLSVNCLQCAEYGFDIEALREEERLADIELQAEI